MMFMYRERCQIVAFKVKLSLCYMNSMIQYMYVHKASSWDHVTCIYVMYIVFVKQKSFSYTYNRHHFLFTWYLAWCYCMMWSELGPSVPAQFQCFFFLKKRRKYFLKNPCLTMSSALGGSRGVEPSCGGAQDFGPFPSDWYWLQALDSIFGALNPRGFGFYQS